MKAHKITIIAIDHEDYGIEDIKIDLEQSRYHSLSVISTETADIGEWSDEHLLNRRDCTEEEALSFFAPEHPDSFVRCEK